MLKRCVAVLLSVVVLVPSVALAQQSKAGVVTTLEGNVSARRVALPTPVSLKFKDDVFLQDTITTAEKALARMLLGGKAVVTVRERSVLTITEVPGRSTIELESGKFALAVAREKMRPGEELQIRTPNAVAGVRGTVVVTEVNRQSAQVGGAAPAVVTNFYVLRGSITAQRLDPSTRQPVGAPLQVGQLQAYTGAGAAPPTVAPVPPEQVGQINAGLQPTGPKGGGDAGQEQVKAQAVQTALTLISTLTGGTGDVQVALAVAPPVFALAAPTATPMTAPLIPDVGEEVSSGRLEKAANTAAALAETGEILGSTTLTNSRFKTFTGTVDSTSTSPILTFTNATAKQTGIADAVRVSENAIVTIAGQLIKMVGSTLTTDGALLAILTNASLKSTGTAALISLDPSTITTTDALIALNGGTLTLAGALLTDTDGTITTGAEFLRLRNSAKLTGTGTGALIQLSGTTVDGSAALSMTDSSMSIAGPLASASNLKDGSGGGEDAAALFKLDNSSLTATGTGSLLSFTSTNVDPDGNFLRLVNESTITLSGPLFSATGGTLKSGLSDSIRAFFSVLDSSKITSTTTSALISMTDVTFDAEGPLFNIRRSKSTSSPTKVSLKGPLFSGTNTTINTTSLGFGSTFGTSGNCCAVFGIEQGSLLESTTGSALISLSGSTVTASDSQSGGSFFLVTDTVTGFPSSELVAPSTVSLEGPLLSATSSTIKPLFSLLQVNRSSVTSTTTSALISLTSSTVAAGGNDISGTATPFARMLTMVSSTAAGTSASAASISLSGPFMSATNSTLSGVQFAGIFNGASFTSTTSSALVSLDNTTLTLSTITQGSTTERGHFVNIGGQGGSGGTTFAKLTLSGPLLSVSNGSKLTLSGSLLNVSAGGQVIESHATSPFVSITGGTHTIASDSTLPILGVFGRSSATTTETISTSGLDTSTSTLTLGTDQPLQRSGTGASLELDGATVSAEKLVNMDNALLSASAPLLSLKSSASLTSAADGLNLTANAKLTVTGPLVKLDSGTLTITSGHAIRVMGGSFLNVSGDLLSISNGGKLDVKAGSPLFISGGSLVKISGAFVNFNSSSGTIKAVNQVCGSPCASQGGISFFTQNGATSANISITNGIKNQGSGTLDLGSLTPVIVLDGANSKVIISGN